MCGGTHGSPWDILPTSYIGQWDRMTVGQDRHRIDMCGGTHGSP